MIPYLIILTLLLFCGFFDILSSNDKQKKFLLAVIFILFVVVDGLRWETGTDWKPYYGYFFHIAEYSWFKYEIGYDLLNNTIQILFNNYTAFLIIHAIIIYTLYLASFYKLSPLPIVAFLVYYSLLIGYTGMNRQHIALAICFYSVTYIFSKQKVKFVLAVLIASLFHFTAIFFLICYFFNRKVPGKSIIIFIIISLIIGQLNFSLLLKPLFAILHIPEFISWKLLIYLKGKGSNSLIWLIAGSIKRVLIFIIVYSLRKRIKTSFPNIDFFINAYLFSILLYFAFNNTVQIIVSRGMLYFGILPEIFLLSSLVLIFKKSYNKIIVFCLLFFFSIFTFSKSIGEFYDLFVPYKGIFINTDFQRKLY